MLSRQERRLALKAMGGAVKHPSFKRMARNIRDYGIAATEVYRIDNADGRHTYFDVFSLRQWARENAEVGIFRLDWDRALHILDSGAIDARRLRDHTIKTAPEPIIVARRASSDGDQIIDGSHRYAAIALSAAANGLVGAEIPVHGYSLEPEEWRPFVIPHAVVSALNLDFHTSAPPLAPACDARP